MGTSTDAILFYGYCWDEESDKPWLIGLDGEDDYPDEDWIDRYIRVKGLAVDDRVDWSKMHELALGSGCQVSTHCSHDCPMPFVAVTASVTKSHRGHMREVKSIAVDPAWRRMLTEFCGTLGIKTDKLRAAWWLVSDWS